MTGDAPTATPTSTGNHDMGSTDHSTDAGAIVAEYRDRLRRATADLPPGRRAELLDDIDAHLADTTAGTPDRTTVLQVLDELGTPEAIAEAALQEAGSVPAPYARSGDTAYDVASVLVLLLGGFVVPVLGWLAGVIMVWNGPRWTTTEKWLGTLAWPVAIAAPVAVVVPVVLAGPQPAIAHWLILASGLVFLAVLGSALVHLLRVAARRRA